MKIFLALVAALGLLAIISALLVVNAVVGGFVLVQLWSWFVAPYFNVAALGLPMAMGFVLVVGFLTNHKNGTEVSKQMTTWEGVWNLTVQLFLKPGLYLLIGFIIKSFI